MSEVTKTKSLQTCPYLNPRVSAQIRGKNCSRTIAVCYWIFTTNETVPVWLGPRVPVNVHWTAPAWPTDGEVIAQPVRLLGSGPQTALTNIVKAGVLSLILRLEIGEVLSLMNVTV